MGDGPTRSDLVGGDRVAAPGRRPGPGKPCTCRSPETGLCRFLSFRQRRIDELFVGYPDRAVVSGPVRPRDRFEHFAPARFHLAGGKGEFPRPVLHDGQTGAVRREAFDPGMRRWVDTGHQFRIRPGKKVHPPHLVPAAVEGMGPVAVVRERFIWPDPFKDEPPARWVEPRLAEPFHFQERIEGQALRSGSARG